MLSLFIADVHQENRATDSPIVSSPGIPVHRIVAGGRNDLIPGYVILNSIRSTATNLQKSRLKNLQQVNDILKHFLSYKKLINSLLKKHNNHLHIQIYSKLYEISSA